MRGHRREDLGPLDTARPSALAVHEHRHEDRLGAARGHGPSAALGEVQEVTGHGHDVGLERGDLGELERVQSVVEQVAAIHRLQQVLEVLATRRVHEPEQAGTVHVGIPGEAGVEVGEQVARGQTTPGEGKATHSNWAPIWRRTSIIVSGASGARSPGS